LRGTFDVMVLHGLSSSTAWFLVESGRAVKPLIVQFEVRPEFVAADDPKSEHVLLKKIFIYQAYGRWNAGYGLPMMIIGSTGAG
jgi:phage major head subunit gpT-like protein